MGSRERYVVLGVIVLALAACGRGGSLTGPSSSVETEERMVTWHGALVTDPALLPLLDRAGPAVAARFPGRTLGGWVIESTPGYISAPGNFYCGPVRCQDADPKTAPEQVKVAQVTTLRGAYYVDPAAGVKTIRVSTILGAADTVAMLTREMCNAIRYDLTHVITDEGCAGRAA